jgi:hypothetical protein
MILDARHRPVKLFQRAPQRIALQNELDAILEVEVTYLAVFDGRKTMKAGHIFLFSRALNVSGFKTNVAVNDCQRHVGAGRLR